LASNDWRENGLLAALAAVSLDAGVRLLVRP